MAMTKERQINPRSLENLKLGAKARDKGKIRRNTTLLPETIEWLDSRGNASGLIDQLVKAAKSGELKPSNTHEKKDNEQHLSSNNTHEQIRALQAELIKVQEQLAAVVSERDRLQQQLEQLNQADVPTNLESVSDRFLASLRLGKQAPEYKRTKKAIDSFIAFMTAP